MKIEDIKNICVIGAGNMGHQIVTLYAIKGYKTPVFARSAAQSEDCLLS